MKGQRAAGNEWRVLDVLRDGGWHDVGEFENAVLRAGSRLAEAHARCISGGLIEFDGCYNVRITDVGRVRLDAS